jgi:hypothetical protein
MEERNEGGDVPGKIDEETKIALRAWAEAIVYTGIVIALVALIVYDAGQGVRM